MSWDSRPIARACIHTPVTPSAVNPSCVEAWRAGDSWKGQIHPIPSYPRVPPSSWVGLMGPDQDDELWDERIHLEFLNQSLGSHASRTLIRALDLDLDPSSSKSRHSYDNPVKSSHSLSSFSSPPIKNSDLTRGVKEVERGGGRSIHGKSSRWFLESIEWLQLDFYPSHFLLKTLNSHGKKWSWFESDPFILIDYMHSLPLYFILFYYTSWFISWSTAQELFIIFLQASINHINECYLRLLRILFNTSSPFSPPWAIQDTLTRLLLNISPLIPWWGISSWSDHELGLVLLEDW